MILGNCGDKRIDVLDVIFVLCYRNVLNRKVAVTQPEKSESKRKIVRTAHFFGMWRKSDFSTLLL